MKWLFLFIVTFPGIYVLSPSIASADSIKAVKIEAISHVVDSETKESILFKMSGPVVPKIFLMKGNNPRLVIDLPGSLYSGKNTIALADGKLATTIRTGQHQAPEQKTRVAVDLAKDFAVQFTHEFSEADNTLKVELTGQQPSQPPSSKESLSGEKPAVKPQGEKPIPAVSPAKEIKEKSPVQDVVKKAETPRLLDITFDGSSAKGEMVLFHLNAFYPPAVTAVEKDNNPRVVCDFQEMELAKGIQEKIVPQGKYVQSIRTSKSKNPNKIQVVLELSPDRDYDLQQVFFKNDNLFVLIVNELPAETAK